MEKLPVNPDCAFSGTKYCRLLNMHACEQCTMRGSGNLDEVRRDIDLYETLLPEGGIARLFHSKECQFCKDAPKGERAGFAILDMAHPEPKRVQKWLLGKKVSRIGTMIPVQMSVCKRCRRTFRLIDTLPTVMTVLFGGVGLLLFGAGDLAERLADTATVLPFALWVALVVGGYFLGRLISRIIWKKAETRMQVDVLQHPVIHAMTARGWEPIAKQSKTKLLFSKSRVNRGLGTAEDTPETEPANAPAGEQAEYTV